LNDYIKKNYSDSTFYNTFNATGFTFTQWNIFYLGKIDVKSRNLHLDTMRLFYLLSEYPFFSEMIKCGTRDDPLHHTLHHLMTYIEKYSSTQRKIVSLLTSHGLSMDDFDSEGNTPASLLLQIQMDKEDVNKCNHLTRAYKNLEKICLSPLYENNHIRLCEQCNQPVGLFEDITNHFDKIRHLSENIKEMTRLRDECNTIYRQYGESKSVQRHQYVVDLYRSLLNSEEDKDKQQENL
jgi:hypothetical protein